MRRYVLPLAIFCALLVMAAACSGGGSSRVAQLPPTKTPKPTFTPSPVATEIPLIIPTATAAATNTPESSPTVPPATPTATALAGASFSAGQNMNVRQGPGVNYAVIGQLVAGTGGQITAKNDAGNWYQFSYNGDPGWVSADLITVTGDPASVKVAMNIPTPLPPPPTARPQPAAPPPAPAAPPPAPAAPPPPPASNFAWRVASSGTSAPQGGVPHFSGRVVYADGSPQNGVCVYLGYYGPRTIKFSGGGGAGDGNWSFAPCGSGACTGPFEIYVVECPSNMGSQAAGLTLNPSSAPPPPMSEKFTATITDKNVTGQWEGIVFQKTN
jgi:uncharacterized protein YraI